MPRAEPVQRVVVARAAPGSIQHVRAAQAPAVPHGLGTARRRLQGAVPQVRQSVSRWQAYRTAKAVGLAQVPSRSQRASSPSPGFFISAFFAKRLWREEYFLFSGGSIFEAVTDLWGFAYTHHRHRAGLGRTQPDKTASRRGAQKVSQLRETSAAFERADDSLAPGNHRLRAFLSHPVAASRFGRKSEPRRSAKTVREGAGRAAGEKSRDSVLSETYHALVLMIRVMFRPALVEARLAGARNKTQFAAANATLIGAARRTYPLPPSLR